MNLYLVTQHNHAYDTYDKCVVAAHSLDEATLIHPSGNQSVPIPTEDGEWKELPWYEDPEIENGYGYEWGAPKCSTVYKVGKYTGQRTDPHVICASFNAG